MLETPIPTVPAFKRWIEHSRPGTMAIYRISNIPGYVGLTGIGEYVYRMAEQGRVWLFQRPEQGTPYTGLKRPPKAPNCRYFEYLAIKATPDGIPQQFRPAPQGIEQSPHRPDYSNPNIPRKSEKSLSELLRASERHL